MDTIWVYLICGILWIMIIGGWIIPMARKRIVHEIFMACGLGIMGTLVVVNQLLWERGDILLLVYTGYFLYIPAAVFVVSSFITLHHKGEPTSGWEHTTVFIDSGVFDKVRHPLYLGSAFFTAGMILIIQSIASAILGSTAIVCFWMTSKKEDEFNVKKFGESYTKYMQRVLLWNFLKGF